MNIKVPSLVALLTAVCVAAIAPAATAATISIGSSATGVTPGAVDCSASTPSTAACGTTAGGILFVANGVGNPPQLSPTLLTGGSTEISGVGDGFLFITASNLTAPLGNLSFISDFTNLLLPTGWTAQLTTYFNQSNAVFGTSTLLSTLSFIGGPGPFTSQTDSAIVAGVTGPYSVTELLHIVAPTGGNGNQSMSISAVPGPIVGAGLPGLIAACGGLLALARRRRKELA